MKRYSPALWTLALLFVVSSVTADDSILEIKGKAGPGKGKTIVLISGDEEYRSEEVMPMLAKILAVKHGFDCKVLFSWDKTGKYIDPNHSEGVKGWQHLETADLMLIGTRFRRPSAEDAKYVTAFLDAGKPVIGIRTATHGFNGSGKFGSLGYGAFGPKILGEGWAGHHGGHKRQGARGVIVKENADHPILRSVSDVFAPSDVYGVRSLKDVDKILLRGAVTESLDPDSKIVDGKKNDPMQPAAWLHPYTSPSGKTGTSLCTTMGASVDLVSEDLRRLLVNGVYHLTGLDVPEKADVAYVDPFYPSFYGFIRDNNFWPSQDLQAADYGLGKSPAMPDPKGSPEWNFRPVKK
jgi:hypothetical protein